MPRSRRILLSSLAAAMAWAGAASATGPGSSGGVRWKSAEVAIVVDPSLDRIGDVAAERVRAAATTWQASDAATPSISIDQRAIDGIGYVPGAKNENCVRFAEKGEPLAKGAIAITVLTYDTKTRTILDADVVLNGVYKFGDASEKHKNVYDVQAVLTHELGHLHGLADDHDHDHAAMYAWTSPGETQKRSLSTEDEDALFALYGVETDRDDDAVSAGSCSSAPGTRATRAWTGVAALLGLSAIALRRRAAAGSGAFVLAVAALSSPASASVPADHAQAAFTPAAVAVATITNSNARFEGGLIVTELELSDVTCAGECDALGATIRVAGGQVGDIVQVISHAPVPAVGARVRVEVSASESGLGRHRVAEWVKQTRSEP